MTGISPKLQAYFNGSRSQEFAAGVDHAKTDAPAVITDEMTAEERHASRSERSDW